MLSVNSVLSKHFSALLRLRPWPGCCCEGQLPVSLDLP